jgi:hypothetical protein
MVQVDHPLADASQQIKPQVTLTGASKDSGAERLKIQLHARHPSQRQTDTYFVIAIEWQRETLIWINRMPRPQPLDENGI